MAASLGSDALGSLVREWDIGAGMDVGARRLGVLTVLLCRV